MRLLVPFLLLPPLAAQTSVPAVPRVWNLGVAADASQSAELVVRERLVAYPRDEADEGVDLNGDGDLGDHVLFVYDASRNHLENLGLAVDRFSPEYDVESGLAAVVVDEGDQGGDLNGDGDPWDSVLHLVDLDTGVVTNTGLDTYGPVLVGGGRVACGVNESTDLNGDGDANDVVVHLVEADGTVTNLAWPAFEYRFDGQVLAVAFDEYMHGETDVNNDGDPWDLVLHVHDPVSATSTNTRLAISTGSGSFRVVDGRITCLVDEAAQGGQDLNLDGDGKDSVLFTRKGGTTTNHRLALAPSTELRFAGDSVLMSIREAAQGNADRNGDGDTQDDVLAVLDLAGNALTDLALATPADGPWVDFTGQHVACAVLEEDQGMTDLNGDGDVIDLVLHLVEVGGVTQNLGLASGPVRMSEAVVATSVSEFHHGGVDLNGDGDVQDSVLHVADPATGVVKNLGLHASQLLVDGRRLAFGVLEDSQGKTDLNGDGDAGDLVQFLYLPLADRVIDLELAVWGPSAFGSGGLFAFLVREDLQGGTDLNGDGDATDQVPHVLR